MTPPLTDVKPSGARFLRCWRTPVVYPTAAHKGRGFRATLSAVTLGELILQRAVDLGGRKRLTYRELSARAKAAGYTLSETTINAFVKHPLDEPPRRRTMEALAAALDVDFPTVVNAVAESMGGSPDVLVQAADEERVRAWLTLTEGLSPADRESMLGVVRSVAQALNVAQAQEDAGRENAVIKSDDADAASRDGRPALRDVTR